MRPKKTKPARIGAQSIAGGRANRRKKVRTARKRKTVPKRRKPLKKSSRVRKLARVHAFFTLLSILAYVSAGVLFDPGLLSRDLQKKYAWAADVAVSAWVAGPPGKPNVSATSGCHESLPFVLIDWETTTDTDDYDVYRNSELLVSEITPTFYENGNVAVGSSYTYYVVANGPFGNTASDEVQITVATCYIPPPPLPPYIPPPPPPPPTCQITTLDKISLLSWICQPKTNKRKPFFAGTTNITNARVVIDIKTPKQKRTVITQVSANGNGYWSWRDPVRLKKKYYTVTAACSDPADSGRAASASVRFKVGKRLTKKTLKRCQQAGYQSLASQSITPPPYSALPGFDFSDPREFFYSGKAVDVRFTPGKGRTIPLSLAMTDVDGNPILTAPAGNAVELPANLVDGNYKLNYSADWNGNQFFSEKIIPVKERPLVVFGNMSFKRSEIVSRLGWITFGSGAIMLVFLLLLMFEYHLVRRADHYVDENELKHDGFID